MVYYYVEFTVDGKKEGETMTNNLIAELVKKGVQPRAVAKDIARTIGVSEKTARNKINGITEWTLPEAVKINEVYFSGALSVEYLFQQSQTTA